MGYIYYKERFFFFGGESDNETYGDLWQFSVELNCLSQFRCTQCLKIDGMNYAYLFLFYIYYCLSLSYLIIFLVS